MTAGDRRLPLRAGRYLYAIVTAAVAVAVPALLLVDADVGDLAACLLLAACAAVGQVLVLESKPNHGFATSLTFVVAAAVLLPPGLVAVVAAGQHVPHIVRRRLPRYIRTFNVASDTLCGLAAALTVQAGIAVGLEGPDLAATAGAAACVVLVGLNHLLLATMLRLARGRSFRESGLFSAGSLAIDLVLALLGIGLATSLDASALLVVAALAPLVLLHRLLALMAAGHRARSG